MASGLKNTYNAIFGFSGLPLTLYRTVDLQHQQSSVFVGIQVNFDWSANLPGCQYEFDIILNFRSLRIRANMRKQISFSTTQSPPSTWLLKAVRNWTCCIAGVSLVTAHPFIG